MCLRQNFIIMLKTLLYCIAPPPDKTLSNCNLLLTRLSKLIMIYKLF